MSGWAVVGVVVVGLLVAVAAYDLLQRRHAILRNFPVIGHLRYLLEGMGPELRQYIVTDNDADQPFSRDQRRWIYASAKRQDNRFGFGTDNDLDRTSSYVIVKQSSFPLDEPTGPDADVLPVGKVLGGSRGRDRAVRMPSVVNVSGMSFGSLGARAVESLNRGAALAGCWQSTGEGGITSHHAHGGELIWQIGTGYFGCRDATGRFDLARFRDVVAAHPEVRAVEIKISQGAKPGLGGLLPGAKVTPEIAALRGVPVGVDCVSPARHSAFSDADSLLDFVELLAGESGLPVGIKSAVGDDTLFRDLARLMAVGDRGIDHLTVDGGEGGTGAAPLVFADHVSLPFRVAFPRVYRAFLGEGMADRVAWIASAKLGFADRAIVAFCLGADLVNVAREAMLSVGCIQAQKCHTGHCPTGVATNDPRYQHGLIPEVQAERFARYLRSLRNELLAVTHACGYEHPSEFTADDVEVSTGAARFQSLRELEGYTPARPARPRARVEA